MNSVRSRFENASHTPEEPGLTPKSARPASKWDKPKSTPPPPVNAHSDEETLSPEEGKLAYIFWGKNLVKNNKIY